MIGSLGLQRLSEILGGAHRAMKCVVKVKPEHGVELWHLTQCSPGDKIGEVRDDVVNASCAEKAERPRALKEGS